MDIVDRLRQRIGLVKFDSDAIALHDAADTIEQLRGQVDFERQCREDTYADLEKQDDEIERLRNNQSILITSFRINMMRLRPDYSHEEFDKDIAAMLKEKE